MKEITPKQDIVFKRLFGSVGSENILRGLLEAILDIKIERVALNLNKELVKKYIRAKKNVLDVLAKLEDGTLINIEMQMATDKSLEKRSLDYWSDLYTMQLEKGEKYENLRKTIAIWILDEDYFKELKEYHNVFKIKEQSTNNDVYFKDFELHFLELNKLRNSDILKPKKLDFWMWFIDHTNKELVEMAYKSEKEIEEAVEKLRELSSDKLVTMIMKAEDRKERDMLARLDAKYEAGVEAGIEEGEKRGKLEEKLEIAKKLKFKGLSIKEIAEMTGLSEEEIVKL